MRYWKWLLVGSLVLFISTTQLVGCLSGTTVQAPEEAPSDQKEAESTNVKEKSRDLETGIISGRIMYRDGTPGYKARVLIVKPTDTWHPLDSAYADPQGYYTFEGVQPGTYWVNTAPNWSYTTNDPDAIVTVSAGEDAIVEDLISYKDLTASISASKERALINSQGGRYWKTVVQESRPHFSWTKVPNAAYYELEVWSTYTDKYPSNRDYSETVTTTDTEITWPTDLNALVFKEFRIDVSAFTEEGVWIAYNGLDLFCVYECEDEFDESQQ